MRERALHYLRTALANPAAEFHAGQWECMEALLARQRLLVVQRTGWGKSMVYFLATKLLRERGEGITLLISPERLANDAFRDEVLLPIANRIGLFVVDEAHCISDWGHDFRPDYRRIVRVIQALPGNIPVLATTATANDRVVTDVAAQLGSLGVERGPLMRASLMLQNIWLPSPAARMAWLAETLPRLPGSGIIYTLTVRDAERVATWLKMKGIAAEAYHSEIENAVDGSCRRTELEQQLLNNQLKALVATVALGMGFDKPDIGFVIHFQRPGSVVHYYQQVGRAGRAVERAYAVLLSGEEDANITDFFIRQAFPPQAHVESVLDALNGAADGLSEPMLERECNLAKGDITKVLKLLSVEAPSPVVKRGARWYATPVRYTLNTAMIGELSALRRAEQQTMLTYARTTGCLMQYLAKELDDPTAAACGRCANCAGHPLLSEKYLEPLANEAAIFLKRSYQRLEPRKRWPSDALSRSGFRGKIPDTLQVQEGRALSLWNDAGWGQMVKAGKYGQGRFDDALVEGCVQLLAEWKPQPAPTWITSNRRE